MTLGKAIRVLSSKEILLWLAGAWIFYYVTFSFLADEAFGRFMLAMGSRNIVRIPYMLFVICLTLNIIRVFRQMWKAGRVRAIAAVVLPVGIVVFLSAFYMSAIYRESGWVRVGEGETVSPPWAGIALKVGAVSSALEKRTLQAEESGLIFAYEPKALLFDGKTPYIVGAFPPTKIGNTYYHILNFNLGPGVRLAQEGKELMGGYLMLGLLPPGAQDSFELPSFPYVFDIRIVPEKIVQKGDTRMKLYDFDNLAYEVVVRRGEDVLFEGNSAEEPVAFDGMQLSFMKPRYWVLLEVVKDPGRPVLLLSFAVIAVGLPLWLLSFLIKRRRAD